ncbi:MAG: GDP-mannose 4,6-dehydratase [Candidatus Aenigmarchaeota archaeon]|nr:GDP-mannose 4,6-dehydratase [Candidatus Aenigmarchaeota archaeon]
MRALITGISGFVGSHLAEYLLSRDYEVFGSIRWRSRLDNIAHIKDKITLVETDMRDSHSVVRLVNDTEPDVIFHLAAQSFVPTSWNAPQDTIFTNVIGTVNLLEAVRSSKIDPKIQIAGSSEEYGLVHENETPIKESNPLRPMSPYGVSKVAEDMLGFQYHKSYSIKTIITRAFNHSGPRRGEVFVESNFARQIAEIEKGAEPVVLAGNLEAMRDFTDVRDVIKAYALSVERCRLGEVYNICSEKAMSIKSILDTLLSFSGEKIAVKNDPARMRPSDVNLLVGDCSKFRKETGWKTEIPLKKTLEDLLNYWRHLV